MNKRLLNIILVCMLAAVLAGCGPLNTAGTGPPVLPSPTPCVTATPAADKGVQAAQSIAVPAGQTAPAGESAKLEPTLSAPGLATQEAQLSHQNQPVHVPSAEELKSTSLPVCPTPTPAP
jgi:hypothetical protein